MIIEGDGTTGTAMSQLLEHAGVVAAGRARLADPPLSHCIVVDLLLPDGSGLEILELVRVARLGAKVAFLTGSTHPDDAKRVKAKSGADAVFVKPVDVLGVVRWVQASRAVAAN